MAALSRVALDVESVVPVHNEERALAASVYRLHHVLSGRVPFTWLIAIADNASTDGTQELANALASKLEGVQVLRLEPKGRGRALRAALVCEPGERRGIHGRGPLD